MDRESIVEPGQRTGRQQEGPEGQEEDRREGHGE